MGKNYGWTKAALAKVDFCTYDDFVAGAQEMVARIEVDSAETGEDNPR